MNRRSQAWLWLGFFSLAGIALALLDSRFVVDEQVQVDVRSRREAFTITKPPFVTPGVREP